jgi:hypothetical protein
MEQEGGQLAAVQALALSPSLSTHINTTFRRFNQSRDVLIKAETF